MPLNNISLNIGQIDQAINFDRKNMDIIITL